MVLFLWSERLLGTLPLNVNIWCIAGALGVVDAAILGDQIWQNTDNQLQGEAGLIQKSPTLLLRVETGSDNATLSVDGRRVWWKPVIPVRPANHDPYGLEQRGLVLLVLHPVTGQLLNEACFTGWMDMDTGHHFRQLVSNTHHHALMVFLSLGEVGPAVDHIPEMTAFMKSMGARHFHKLYLEDRHVLVRAKNGVVYSESFVSNKNHLAERSLQSPPGKQTALHASVTVPSKLPEDILCRWRGTSLDSERALFCYDYGGYGDLCNCSRSDLLPITPTSLLPDNSLIDVPVAIVAGNRPRALWRTLRSLLANPGAEVEQVIVYVDGYFKEVDRLCHLLRVRCVSIINEEDDTILRIRHHYKTILTSIWKHFPSASRAIFLEEDLEVSPDFISYFSQTSHLLDADSSLWCISAWNDNGYEASSSDPALLYRVEYMPGLGWMMLRHNVEALLAKWPSKGIAYDWDVWARWDSNRLGRECVIPDISRTYHFGISGRHMTGTFHTMYYLDHALNNQSHVKLHDVDMIVKDRYEDHIKEMMKKAIALHPDDFLIEGDMKDGGGGECRVNITGKNNIYTVFFAMAAWEDKNLFRTLAKCFMIWDLDVRGHHHGLWRFTCQDNHILMFGVPITRYMNDAMTYLNHPIEVINSLGP